MSCKHHVILAIVICTFVLVVPSGMKFTQPTLNGVNTKLPAAIDILQMLSDSKLALEPDVQVNGTSDEFSYAHEPNSLELNWTHTNGTSLDVRATNPDDAFPYFNAVSYTHLTLPTN